MNRKQIKKLDKLWRNHIKERDKYICRRCGKGSKSNNASHITSRNYYPLRWELINGLTLCVACHFWAHQNPLAFAEYVKIEVGKKNYQMLIGKLDNGKRMDYEKVLKTLEAGIPMGELK